jgi:uncharacterized RDD family membrane protein YckC
MEPTETTPEISSPLPPAQKAGAARRLSGGLIDVAAVLGAGIVYTLALGSEQESSGGLSFSLNDKVVTGGSAWLFVGLAMFYFVVAEVATGRTMGKVLVGTKVQMADGRRLTPGAAVVRNLFRVIDGVPYAIPNLLGFIVVASTEDKQRVGDLVAKTVVVITD